MLSFGCFSYNDCKTGVLINYILLHVPLRFLLQLWSYVSFSLLIWNRDYVFSFYMLIWKCRLCCIALSLFPWQLIRRGGYGKLVQKELETQRQLVDYGTGSLGAYQTNMPSRCKFLNPTIVQLLPFDSVFVHCFVLCSDAVNIKIWFISILLP